MPQRAEIPIPKLPSQTVCRLLNNLAYGQAVDPDGWGIPMLKARPADSPDPALACRLVDAFYRAVEAGGSAGDGLWTDMGEAFHGPFLAALESRDMNAVAAMLAGMFYEPITAGLCRRERDPAAFQADTMARLLAADVLVSLGTALGVVHVHNPFSQDDGNPLVFDAGETMSAIRDVLGREFAPPQVGGIFGIEYDGALYPHKYLYQVYVAHRLNTIMGRRPYRCLEIGGGVGFLAHAAVQLTDVQEFCVIDLPVVNILQGYLMLKSPLANLVSLYGEPRRRIRILPDNAIGTLKRRSFDVAVNQDSLPEMDRDTMTGYLAHIRRLVRSYFLSINHESGQTVGSGFTHGVVSEAVGGQAGFESAYRMPYWLRPGYVEELYRLHQVRW